MTFAPLRGRRPKRKPASEKLCLAGCGQRIPGWQWLCNTCFKALPASRKKEICAARERRDKASVYAHAHDAAEWLVEKRAKEAEA